MIDYFKIGKGKQMTPLDKPIQPNDPAFHQRLRKAYYAESPVLTDKDALEATLLAGDYYMQLPFIMRYKSQKQKDLALFVFAAKRETFNVAQELIAYGANPNFIPPYTELGLANTGDNALMYYLKQPSNRYYYRMLPSPRYAANLYDKLDLTHHNRSGDSLFTLSIKRALLNEVLELIPLIQQLPTQRRFDLAINWERAQERIRKRMPQGNYDRNYPFTEKQEAAIKALKNIKDQARRAIETYQAAPKQPRLKEKTPPPPIIVAKQKPVVVNKLIQTELPLTY